MLAEIHNFTAEEYKQYQKSLKSMGDFDNIISSTAELAEMRGLEKGLLEKAVSIAKEMLADGMPTEMVCKYTGLSADEVEALRS